MKEAWKAVGITVLAVVVVVVIWWVTYGAKVFTSEFTGQGDAIIQRNSAENWVKAQADFEDLYADIESQDRSITLLAETVEKDPSEFNQRNYDGARLICMETVGDYNAKARQFLSQDFRSADLPYEIDEMSPSTDCKE